MIRRLDHVAVVVADTEIALRHFRDHLGLGVVTVDEPPEVPVRLTYLDLGNAWIQLVEPLDDDHPLAVWLREHGEGLHHICLAVDDVEAELRRLSPPGVQPPPLGSGRGRAAGFPAGEPPHGTRIECTTFDPETDLGLGMLTMSRTGHGSPTPRQVAESYWAAECRRDIDAVIDHYHADATYEDPSGQYSGHKAIRAAYEKSAREYPGLEVEIVREFPLGNRSALEFEAFLIDPAGRRHLVRGVNLVHVSDGRFVSVRSYEDVPGAV